MTRLNLGQSWLLVCAPAVALAFAWALLDRAAGRWTRRGVGR